MLAPRPAGTRAATPPAAPPTVQVITTGLTMAALIALWLVAQLTVLGAISHDRAQTLLYRDLRFDLSQQTAPLGPPIEPGTPVALLTLPTIGVEEVVIEGTNSGDLRNGPGHRRGTPLPGQVGTSVVYGRAATYGAPFRELPKLAVGDPIVAVTAQGTQTFSVIGLRREGDPLPQPVAGGVARLTLVTAEGSGPFARFTPSETVFVDAEAAEGFGAPSAPTGALPPEAEQAMGTDPEALPALALCLALLVALTLGVVALRQRLSAVLTWVIASPLVMALAWITTDTAARLLPNLV